jgi:NAD kinase
MVRRAKLRWGISPDSKKLRPHVPEGRRKRSASTFDNAHQVMVNLNRRYHRISSHASMRLIQENEELRRKKQKRNFALIVISAVGVAFMITAGILALVL